MLSSHMQRWSHIFLAYRITSKCPLWAATTRGVVVHSRFYIALVFVCAWHHQQLHKVALGSQGIIVDLTLPNIWQPSNAHSKLTWKEISHQSLCTLHLCSHLLPGLEKRIPGFAGTTLSYSSSSTLSLAALLSATLTTLLSLAMLLSTMLLSTTLSYSSYDTQSTLAIPLSLATLLSLILATPLSLATLLSAAWATILSLATLLSANLLSITLATLLSL